jgi:hypothetical protein
MISVNVGRRAADENGQENAAVGVRAIGHVIAVQNVDVSRRALFDVVESIEVDDFFDDRR